MKAEKFVSIVENNLNIEFFTGVPDSLLSPFTNEIMSKYGVSDKHIIAANEGNALGLAAGYHMATGKTPCVYMQNSGQGNVVNPFASLVSPDVYRIPCLFIVGWRGEPGVHDEPQHVFQGKITKKLWDLLEIKNYVITEKTTEEELAEICLEMKELLLEGLCTSFIIEKGALSTERKVKYTNDFTITRETAIEEIVSEIGNDLIISTTGKASRELFEIRERRKEDHSHDFLTVGSMGHSSSIALGIAIQKTNQKIWCIDGDGAALMHMGAMAVIGAKKPKNLVHIVINNESHETVGGLPTVAGAISLTEIAKACGYLYVECVDSVTQIREAVKKARNNDKLSFIEIRVANGARSDLGRPTTTAIQNKEAFMNYIKGIR